MCPGPGRSGTQGPRNHPAWPMKGVSRRVTDPDPCLHANVAQTAMVSVHPHCTAGLSWMAAGGGLHPHSGLPLGRGPLWTQLWGLPQAGGPDPLPPPCSRNAQNGSSAAISPSFPLFPLPNKNRSVLSPAWGNGTPRPQDPETRRRTTASAPPRPWAPPCECSVPGSQPIAVPHAVSFLNGQCRLHSARLPSSTPGPCSLSGLPSMSPGLVPTAGSLAPSCSMCPHLAGAPRAHRRPRAATGSQGQPRAATSARSGLHHPAQGQGWRARGRGWTVRVGGRRQARDSLLVGGQAGQRPE